MRVLVAALVLTTIAFAGCFGGDDGDDDPSPTTSPSPTGSPSPSASPSPSSSPSPSPSPSPGPNSPPTASLSASIQQGEVPVNVTFTLDGNDEDGDALTWTFDADEDGTFEAEGSGDEFPATVNHSYQQNGTYNATLTVSDGTNSTSQTVTINATAAAGGGGSTSQSVSTEWILDNPYWTGDGAAALEEDAFPEELEGVTYASFAVEPGTYGSSFHAVYGCNAEIVDGISFYDGDGNRLLRMTDLDEGDFCDIQGSVPSGAVTGYFWSGGGGDSVTYTAG